MNVRISSVSLLNNDELMLVYGKKTNHPDNVGPIVAMIAKFLLCSVQVARIQSTLVSTDSHYLKLNS